MIYSNWLREKSHNAIKFGEVEGNPCVLKYSKGKNLKNYEIYGNSIQETRSGKNLLPYPPYAEGTKTENNITFTDNGDGTITVNGTASADTTFNLCTALTLTAETYTFSGCPSGGSDTTYFISGFTGTDIGSGFTVTLDSDTTDTLSITIKSGTTISNKTFKPQIEVGSEKTSYEQYGAMPSPEYPSEIKSVGDLTTKNLFDKDKEKYKILMQSDTIILGGNYYTIFIDVENISNFTMSIKNENTAYYGLCDSIEVGSEIYEHKYFATTIPRTITNNTHKYLGISIWYTAISAFADVQVEEGTTATEYEPYHKYDVPVTVTGKNLFKPQSEISNIELLNGNISISPFNDGAVAITGTPIPGYFNYVSFCYPCAFSNSAAGSKQVNDVIVPQGNSFVLSWERIRGMTAFEYIVLTDSDGGTHGVTMNYLKGYAIISARDYDVCNIYFRFPRGSKEYTFNDVYRFQVTLGTEVLPFEPYVEPITQHIYLDEPLRGIGEYSDYIDFRNKKVVRNINHLNINGGSWGNRVENDCNIKTFQLSKDIIAIDASTSINCICNMFSGATRWEIRGVVNGIAANSNYIRLWNPPISDLSSDEFLTWIEQNPIDICYILATPIEEPIDDLPDIITNNSETCIIRTDTKIQASNIKVKYIRV